MSALFPSIGVYVSVPFCRAKCTYCNFASGVFSADRMARYVDRLVEDIHAAPAYAASISAALPRAVDTIYLGGGTPSLLGPDLLGRIFSALRETFSVSRNAEITLECAPGQLSDPTLDALPKLGVNRVSFGVQSFVDREAAAVGRQHTRADVLRDFARLRAIGITNINADLIAGLPHQTSDSWMQSLTALLESQVPHASIYMLEIDEDSRLGTELIAGGVRYHAHAVPDDDLIADLYTAACEIFPASTFIQYEISNFARPGHAAIHNEKYWSRAPYLGFGLDASSMLLSESRELNAIRFTTTDSLDALLSGPESPEVNSVDAATALEEAFFLGLRRTSGVSLDRLMSEFGTIVVTNYSAVIDELITDSMLVNEDESIRLTPRGRLLSNEVFSRFLLAETSA